MSEKGSSKNGNVPEEQADEAELLPPDNIEAAQEAELHPVEAELFPPEKDKAEEQEAELHPVEAELFSPEKDKAEEQETELHPVEAESTPDKDEGKAELLPPGNEARTERQKLNFHSIEAIIERIRNKDSEVKGKEGELHPVEAEMSPEKKARTERQKPKVPLADVILQSPRNDDAEGREFYPIENEPKDSDNGSSPEGAVADVIDCHCGDIHFSPCAKKRIQSGKEDIFKRFFSNEYDQPIAPIPGRQRHSAQKQRPRRRHLSEDSKSSDENPLGCLQDAGTSGGAVLNQAGAIIGKYIPQEEIPEYARFGTEFGQSLPVIPTTEGSERSIGSVSTTRIGEVYGGTFSVISDLSYDSEFAQRLSTRSFSSRPPTSASGNQETSSPSNSSKDDKEQLSTAADSEKPVRQRLGIVAKPEPIRCKSALAGLSAYASESEDELQQRKISKTRSVRSEPLPQRKISKSPSEQMSLEDEANHLELSHSLERDSDVPVPDVNAAVDSLEENLGSLKISEIESSTGVQNVAIKQETEVAEQDLAIANTESTTEQNVAMDEIKASESAEQDPETAESCSHETEATEPKCE